MLTAVIVSVVILAVVVLAVVKAISISCTVNHSFLSALQAALYVNNTPMRKIPLFPFYRR